MSEPVGGIGDFLGDAGALPVIECGGKSWQIGKPTQRAKDALEELVVRAAWAQVKALAAFDAEQYELAKADHFAALQKGEYKTFGPRWGNLVSGTAESGARFLCALLRERHPEATEADAMALLVNGSDDVREALLRVVPPFAQILLESYPAVKAASPQTRERLREQIITPFLQGIEAAMRSLKPQPSTPGTPTAAA